MTDESREFTSIALSYAEQVVAGRRIAGRLQVLACKRFLADYELAAQPDCAWSWSDWDAQSVCEFIEQLPHVEGVWDTPNIRLEDPQIWLLANVFGFRQRRRPQARRFSRVYIEMARKGAKSTLTAGVALYCLTCEEEPGAQVIVGATTGEQAGKVFNPSKQMVLRTPALREAFGLEPYTRSIVCRENGGYMQPINAKGKTQDGWNPHVGILDELHAHPNRALYDVIASAFGSRKNPLMWMITTAGYSTIGVCYEQRQYVQKMLDGVIDAPHYFGAIFTVDEGDDLYDPKVWIKANPMLGVTPTVESMQRDAADARASPSSEGEFLTKRLNVWRNAAHAWLNTEQWKACGDASLSWDAFDGLEVWVGCDLADKDDICAIGVAAWDRAGRLLWKPMFYLPEAILQQPEHAEGRGTAPYKLWADEGYLQLTPGDWIDHDEVERQIREWLARYAVKRVTFDQFAAAQAMASRINGEFPEPIAAILQKRAGNYTDGCKDLEARVKSGADRFVHDDNPVMNWMASNVSVTRRRDETLLPVKEDHNSPNKIDGIDALIMAIQPALLTADDQATRLPDSYKITVV